MRKLLTLIAPLFLLSACAGNMLPCNAQCDMVPLEARTVYFDTNKSTLSAKGQAKLASLAKMLKDTGKVESVNITGFADRRGGAAANEKLSAKRANTVKNFMGAHGIKGNVVSTSWVGESQSKTPCEKDTSACLSPDRKVEISVNYVTCGR